MNPAPGVWVAMTIVAAIWLWGLWVNVLIRMPRLLRRWVGFAGTGASVATTIGRTWKLSGLFVQPVVLEIRDHCCVAWKRSWRGRGSIELPALESSLWELRTRLHLPIPFHVRSPSDDKEYLVGAVDDLVGHYLNRGPDHREPKFETGDTPGLE